MNGGDVIQQAIMDLQPYSALNDLAARTTGGFFYEAPGKLAQTGGSPSLIAKVKEKAITTVKSVAEKNGLPPGVIDNALQNGINPADIKAGLENAKATGIPGVSPEQINAVLGNPVASGNLLGKASEVLGKGINSGDGDIKTAIGIPVESPAVGRPAATGPAAQEAGQPPATLAPPEPKKQERDDDTNVAYASGTIVQLLMGMLAIISLLSGMGIMMYSIIDRRVIRNYDPVPLRLKSKDGVTDKGLLEFKDTIEYALLMQDGSLLNLFGGEKEAVSTIVYMGVGIGSLFVAWVAYWFLLMSTNRGSQAPRFERNVFFKIIMFLSGLQIMIALFYYYFVYKPFMTKIGKNKLEARRNALNELNAHIHSNLYMSRVSSEQTRFYSYLANNLQPGASQISARNFILENARQRNSSDIVKMMFTYNLYMYFYSQYSDPDRFLANTDQANLFKGNLLSSKTRYERYFNVFDIAPKVSGRGVIVPNLFSRDLIDTFADRIYPSDPASADSYKNNVRLGATPNMYDNLKNLMTTLDSRIREAFIWTDPKALRKANAKDKGWNSDILDDFNSFMDKRRRIWVGSEIGLVLVAIILIAVVQNWDLKGALPFIGRWFMRGIDAIGDAIGDAFGSFINWLKTRRS